jgi:hypothetical protein
MIDRWTVESIVFPNQKNDMRLKIDVKQFKVHQVHYLQEPQGTIDLLCCNLINIKFHGRGLVLSHYNIYHINTTTWTTTNYHHTSWNEGRSMFVGKKSFYYSPTPKEHKNVGLYQKSSLIKMSITPLRHYCFFAFIVRLIVITI